jgi:hypothetical protein
MTLVAEDDMSSAADSFGRHRGYWLRVVEIDVFRIFRMNYFSTAIS